MCNARGALRKQSCARSPGALPQRREGTKRRWDRAPERPPTSKPPSAREAEAERRGERESGSGRVWGRVFDKLGAESSFNGQICARSVAQASSAFGRNRPTFPRRLRISIRFRPTSAHCSSIPEPNVAEAAPKPVESGQIRTLLKFGPTSANARALPTVAGSATPPCLSNKGTVTFRALLCPFKLCSSPTTSPPREVDCIPLPHIHTCLRSWATPCLPEPSTAQVPA